MAGLINTTVQGQPNYYTPGTPQYGIQNEGGGIGGIFKGLMDFGKYVFQGQPAANAAAAQAQNAANAAAGKPYVPNMTSAMPGQPTVINPTTAAKPATTGLVSAPSGINTANAASAGNTSMPINMNGANGGVGNLNSVQNGQQFSFGGLTYQKNADGSISPVNGNSGGNASGNASGGGNNTPPPPPQQPSTPAGTPGNTYSPQLPNGAAYSNPAAGGGTNYYDAHGNLIGHDQGGPQGSSPVYNPYTANPQLYAQLTTGLANIQDPNSALNQQINQGRQNIQDLQTQYGQQLSNINASRTNLAEAGGEQGNLQNLYQNSLGAAQTNLQNALEQRSQQIGALETAAGLAAPQQVSPTNAPYNPVTGTYGSPAYNAYGQGGQNGMQTIGGIQAQQGIGQLVGQLNSQLGAAQRVATDITNLIQQNNINPHDVNAFNAFEQYFRTGVFNDPKYQAFQGEMQDLISKLAPILAGGDATNMKTQMASAMVNAQASGQSIADVINHYIALAHNTIQGYSTGYNPNGAVGGQSGGNSFYGTNWFQ